MDSPDSRSSVSDVIFDICGPKLSFCVLKRESSDAGREKGESFDARQTESLPQDMANEILSRSQVKPPLMGFKLLCKTWKQCMESPHIRQHFDLKTGECLIYYGECKICSGDADVIQKDILVRGCNGMVVKKNLETVGFFTENPSMHQERAVPPPPRPRNHLSIFLVFIQSTRTYKLFSSTTDSDGTPLLQVLTLEVDHDWRPQQFFINEDEEIGSFACTGAFIHMIKLVGDADQERSAELVTFDMEHEKFTTTVMEQSLFSDWESVYLLNWNGSPGLVDRAARGLNLLIIEDYRRTHRIAGSKLHIELDLPNNFCNATPFVAHQDILWMHAGGSLLAYNLQRRRPYGIPGNPSCYFYDFTNYFGITNLETVKDN